jgi:predicted TIM-barrel fold metal-dependent hydrolase
VIVDCHTHVFPPAVVAGRERYVEQDATFAELYGSPEAKLATAEDLLRSMDAAGIDVSVALGFAWADPETCRLHNDYILEAAAASGGRIVAFPNLPLAARLASGFADLTAIEAEARRCAAAGARGFGELRPENAGFSIAPPDELGESRHEGEMLARVAEELGAVLLFHVSEPVGHAYAGKKGLALKSFYAFVSVHPGVRVIGAHWGGGLPFYASMPEVKHAFSSLRVDTAASSLLYDEGVYRRGVDLAGAETVLFGSDYPLLSQARSKRRVEEAGLTEDELRLVLGGNAAVLLALS